MTKKNIFILLTTAMALTACQSDDNLPVQHPDGYGTISFSALTEKPVTRADNTSGYESYDPTRHPQTMGVFGYHDLTTAKDNIIFSNTPFQHKAGTKAWDYQKETDKKYWQDYTGSHSFDFVAYMPHREKGVSFDQVEGKSAYTLSLKVPSIEERKSAEESAEGPSTPFPILTDTKKAPIICNAPVHETQDIIHTKDKVKFLFDQTLTGYNINFQLDLDMNKIRHLIIKKVKIYGKDLPVSGTINRTYTWDNTNKTWSAGDITWTDIQKDSIPEAKPFVLQYAKKSETDTETTLHVTNDNYQQWGSNFYTIPDASFNPTIQVTYDVELVKPDQTAEAGSTAETVITRQDVTSRIVFNKTNFDKISAGKPGHINSIRILIKPAYLYVLADEDKCDGLLLVP